MFFIYNRILCYATSARAAGGRRLLFPPRLIISSGDTLIPHLAGARREVGDVRDVRDVGEVRDDNEVGDVKDVRDR